MQCGLKCYPCYFVKSFVKFPTCLWKRANPVFDIIRIKDKLIYQTLAISLLWIMKKIVFPFNIVSCKKRTQLAYFHWQYNLSYLMGLEWETRGPFCFFSSRLQFNTHNAPVIKHEVSGCCDIFETIENLVRCSTAENERKLLRTYHHQQSVKEKVSFIMN